MIIGLSGKKQSGKDTVARIIQFLTCKQGITKWDVWESLKCDGNGSSDWKTKQFAYPVKQIASIMTGIPINDFEKEEVKASYLGEEWAHTEDMTVRDLLQKIGTEVGRQIHPNVWTNVMFKEYIGRQQTSISKDCPNQGVYDVTENDELQYGKLETIYPNWIITDCRFPNEYDAIKERHGIVIRVNRHNHPHDSNSNHPSEVALDNHTFDYTINNNGTIEELIEQVKQILIKEKICG